MRRGAVRILMGSTFKMGAGTNVQDLIIASHDLDCPWRPRDLEQRAGRTVRQGKQKSEGRCCPDMLQKEHSMRICIRL